MSPGPEGKGGRSLGPSRAVIRRDQGAPDGNNVGPVVPLRDADGQAAELSPVQFSGTEPSAGPVSAQDGPQRGDFPLLVTMERGPDSRISGLGRPDPDAHQRLIAVRRPPGSSASAARPPSDGSGPPETPQFPGDAPEPADFTDDDFAESAPAGPPAPPRNPPPPGRPPGPPEGPDEPKRPGDDPESGHDGPPKSPVGPRSPDGRKDGRGSAPGSRVVVFSFPPPAEPILPPGLRRRVDQVRGAAYSATDWTYAHTHDKVLPKGDAEAMNKELDILTKGQEKQSFWNTPGVRENLGTLTAGGAAFGELSAAHPDVLFAAALTAIGAVVSVRKIHEQGWHRLYEQSSTLAAQAIGTSVATVEIISPDLGIIPDVKYVLLLPLIWGVRNMLKGGKLAAQVGRKNELKGIMSDNAVAAGEVHVEIEGDGTKSHGTLRDRLAAAQSIMTRADRETELLLSENTGKIVPQTKAQEKTLLSGERADEVITRKHSRNAGKRLRRNRRLVNRTAREAASLERQIKRREDRLKPPLTSTEKKERRSEKKAEKKEK